MARKIEMLMVDKGLGCVVELLEEEAPLTCQAVLKALPLEGEFITGQFSGAEALSIFSPSQVERVGPENMERSVLPGDVLYCYAPPVMASGSAYSGATSPRDIVEILYFYDRKSHCAGANLFGVMTEGKEDFCAASQSIRRQGAIRIRLRELKG